MAYPRSTSEQAAYAALAPLRGNPALARALDKQGRQRIATALSLLEDGPHASGPEIEADLGTRRWAICRDTPHNRTRYALCLSPKKYRDMEARCLAKRAKQYLDAWNAELSAA